MLRPIDTVRCFHKAFRLDIFKIDKAVLDSVRSGGDIIPMFDRLHLLGEILDYHAKGEEAAVFPVVDKITPLVSQAYLIDHRELDQMVNSLDAIRKGPDIIEAMRATAILHSQLRIHLDKEDVHLYSILRERTTDDEQISIGKIMASKIPPERFADFIHWLFPLLYLEDQMTVIKSWMATMPPPVFAKAKQLIEKNVGDNWAKIIKQTPQLADRNL